MAFLPDALNCSWKNHQKLVEKDEKGMVHRHVKWGTVTNVSQLLDKDLFHVGIVDMSSLNHEPSTNDMLTVIGKVHIFTVLSHSTSKVTLKTRKKKIPTRIKFTEKRQSLVFSFLQTYHVESLNKGLFIGNVDWTIILITSDIIQKVTQP